MWSTKVCSKQRKKLLIDGAILGFFRDNLKWREIDGEGDFIPGDWGYIYNDAHQFHRSMREAGIPDRSGKPWIHGTEGENIIYVGELGFWGHFEPGNTYKPLEKWMKLVGSWKSTEGERALPRLDLSVQCVGVGLASIKE